MAAPTLSLSLIALDAGSSATLQHQLRDALRRRILGGEFPPGSRLPATRTLRRALGIGRNTVLNAYEQLAAEGYLSSRRGSGTFVSDDLPDARLRATAAHDRIAAARHATPVSSGARQLRVATLDSTPPRSAPWPFQPCIPSAAEFPLSEWESLRRRVLNSRGERLLQAGDPAGDRALREVIAVHLRDYRGVRCSADQIVITAGAQHAFNLILASSAQRGGRVWIEDPGYGGFRAAAHAAGAALVPRPVDAEGLALPDRVPEHPPKLIYVTPSRQFPLGVTMSLRRRLALLEFAERTGAWVIEDDYDSEHRYFGRPLPALQGLGENARVIYVGTFTKTIYPSLRLGFLVAPLSLTEDFVRMRAVSDTHSPSIDQAVLAEFIGGGHYARHLRRMQTLYGERLQVLRSEMSRLMGGLTRMEPVNAGLSVVGWLPPGADDAVWSANAAAKGVDVPPLSSYRMKVRLRPGAVFGFAAFPPALIRRSAERLAAAWAG
jgi:GntR family transcriptional regulator/MocR family aminotransferase